MRRVALAALVSLFVLLSGGIATLSADPLFPPPGEEVTAPPPARTRLSTFHPVSPVRLGIHRIGPGKTATISVTGLAGVPTTGVSAVVLNVTALRPTKAGAVTLFAEGERRPVPQVHFPAGQAVAGLLTVKVNNSGKVVVHNRGGFTSVAADLQGWYAEASLADDTSGLRFRATVPTRIATRPMGSRQVAVVKVTDTGGIPDSGAEAVALTILAKGPSKAGFLTIYPQGTARPGTPNVRFAAGQSALNVVITRPSPGGRIAIFNPAGGVQVTVSTVGWYGSGDAVEGGDVEPLSTRRIGSIRLGPSTVSSVLVAGVGGVPETGVAGIVLSVTATGGTANGALTVYAEGTQRPSTPNLFVRRDGTVAAPVMVTLPANGRIAVHNSTGSTRVAVDVQAWYSTPGSEPQETGGGRAGEARGDDVAVPAEVETVVVPERDMLEAFRKMEREGTLLDRVAKDPSSPAPDALGKTESELPRWQTGYATATPAIGRIYMYRGGTFSGTCTGSVVARNLVVTAAHCIYDAVDGYYDGWVFVPGLSGTTKPLGEWEAYSYIVPPYYVEEAGNFSPLDWAFLYFTTDYNGGKLPGDSTGHYPVLYNSPGGYKHSVGYPSEGWFNTNCGTSCYPYFCQSPILGADNFYLWLEDSTVSYGGWYEVGFGCFMTGGASGGPVFEYWNDAWYVSGVNSNITGGPTYTQNCTRRTGVCFQWAHNMWSPYWNDYFGRTYQQFALG